MIINLKHFDEILSTRHRVYEVFSNEVLNSCRTDQLILNFEDVKNVTPSFLHEMLLVLNESCADFKIVNANNSIQFQVQKAKLAIQGVDKFSAQSSK